MVVASDNPEKALKTLTKALRSATPMRDSSRHMAERNLGKQEPTESLQAHVRKFEFLDAA